MMHAPLSSSMVILDRTLESESRSILYAFALEELLCRSIGKSSPPILHIWRHPRAFVMGLRDSRLPEAALANQWLIDQGYDTAVRNSGGAAVPLDLGVVNVSLLLPKEPGDMEHRKDFEMMVALIREIMSKLTDRIDQGEVLGSFCPGEFDLSVGGRKFCGIAQRRQQRALSVQAFIIVEGEGEGKATLARSFYERAAGSTDPADYPTVAPGSMASLAECLNIPLTAEQFTENLIEIMSARGMQVKRPEAIPGYPDEGQIDGMVELLRERYAIKG
ncbi:lipoate--protein ligase family protein [Paenibacillus planticolens]|uniref:Lipoate--protein ligase family protein n=1 Tax=Paenibacillus planticolens TaxID=2654976 RepID=A0ABX1ZYS7_9BACL|nr:lipoate--protein ligase family protein [Paenibacillus planticolens]NOV04147.1 lipoate--protein ligase family protein [Paenibacillus planticolens]